MNGNLIEFYRYKDNQELEAILNLYKVANLVEVVSISDYGDVDMRDFAIPCTGFVFGDDFVTFEKHPKVFPINLSLSTPDYCDVYEPGIYVSKLKDVEKDENFFYDTLIADLNLARNIEKWYFDDFLPNNREYYTDSDSLRDNDNVFYGDKNLNTAPVHQFDEFVKKNK